MGPGAGRHRRVWLALVLGALAGGCTRLAWRLADAPGAVRVEQVALALTGRGSGALTLGLRVQNASGAPARLERVRFELALDGRPFASGVAALSGTLAPGEARALDVRLPLALRPGAGPQEATGRPRRPVARVRGALTLVVAGASRDLPFEDERALPQPLPEAGSALPPAAGGSRLASRGGALAAPPLPLSTRMRSSLGPSLACTTNW